MRLSLVKTNDNAALPSAKKGIITLIHIDEIIAMPKTDYQGIRCLNEIQLKENPQLQYLYLTPFTQKEEITPSGDIESTLFSTKISGTFPGNKIEAAEFLKDNINEPFVIIYEDFTENTKFIYGSKYHPLFIKSDYKSDSTGKLWNFTLEQSHASDTPYLYYVGPQLGGRNLLKNSKNKPSEQRSGSSVQLSNGFKFKSTGAYGFFGNINNLELGQDYTISIKAKRNVGINSNWIQSSLNVDNFYLPLEGSNNLTNEFKVYSLTRKLLGTNSNVQIYISFPSGEIQVEYIKFEKGNKATLWTPAPEDIII